MKLLTKRFSRLALATLVVLVIAAIGWLVFDQQRKIDRYELMAAAAKGDVARVKELVNKVDVNARFGGDGETALHRAAARGRLDVVRLLLDRGANVNAVDEEGSTPLLAATYRGHIEVVTVLLDRGASINVQERRHGFSALTLAVNKGDRELTKLLISRGADVALKTIDGRTALDRAIANGSADIVAQLRAAGATN